MTCMVRSHSSSKAITCFSLACNDICLGRRSILYTLPWRSLQFSSGQAAERSMLLDQKRREGPRLRARQRKKRTIVWLNAALMIAGCRKETRNDRKASQAWQHK